MRVPTAIDPGKVGTSRPWRRRAAATCGTPVLEYRVWCYPSEGAEDLEDGSDYCYAFPTFEEALTFAEQTRGAQEPLALILQMEYINEPTPGRFVHVTSPRVAEWPVEFLSRPKRTERTIPEFLSPTAPANRLDVLLGKATTREDQ
jgi:hypothetical protein